VLIGDGGWALLLLSCQEEGYQCLPAAAAAAAVRAAAAGAACAMGADSACLLLLLCPCFVQNAVYD
jgi:hypothetical protein